MSSDLRTKETDRIHDLLKNTPGILHFAMATISQSRTVLVSHIKRSSFMEPLPSKSLVKLASRSPRRNNRWSERYSRTPEGHRRSYDERYSRYQLLHQPDFNGKAPETYLQIHNHLGHGRKKCYSVSSIFTLLFHCIIQYLTVRLWKLLLFNAFNSKTFRAKTAQILLVIFWNLQITGSLSKILKVSNSLLQETWKNSCSGQLW